ncbi:MAG: protein translocase subunit SecD [Candidatus Magasanikbacteria bacterium]|nr:protein translocase subunit SecD [Candidatus Magasanikbacteria bacterium]
MVTRNTRSPVRSKVRWGLAGIFGLFLVASFFDAPSFFNRGIDKINRAVALGLPHIPDKPFNLGLDLQGGAHLVYQAQVKGVAPVDRAAAVEGVRDVIELRVNGLGVSEPTVQTTKVSDDYHLIVELPGVTDVERAIKMIGETPILEFKEQNTSTPRDLTADEKKELEKYNAEAKKRAADVLSKIQGGLNFAEAVKQFSDDPKSKNNGGYLDFIGKNSAPSELYAWASNAKEGEITQNVVSTSFGYFIAQRGAERDGEPEVAAKHILICYLGAQRCDNPLYTKKEAEEKAKEIFAKANAGNFAQLAKENSTDPGSKDKGGDLGTFPRAGMVKPFADAVFGAKAGEIIGPVETDFGYQVIYKVAETRPKEYAVSAVFIRIKAAADFVPPQEPYKSTGLSGKQLARAEVVTDQRTSAVQVSLRFNDEGKKLFREITERNVGKPVAIFLYGQPISIPTVQQVIPDGQAVISGQFTLEDAKILTQRLNAGALPVPVELISQQTVGATLGIEALAKSLRAGLIGFLLVIVFMVLYYRLPGILASIALAVYATLALAIFKLIGVTLTLSGIAGFILSIGMAVDANVLIFERMKEELRAGKSLRAAVEEGFLRAWPSIRDSNISSLCSAILLLWFGTSFVKGFAVTLALGILVHMFTAITVTRAMLRFIVPWFKERGNRLFLGAQHFRDDV